MTGSVASKPVISAWAFVPLMYFLQALPVSLVQDVSTVLYKDLGLQNETIVRWTTLVALPWSLQMFFGPLVDLTGTRRRWVVRSQLVIALALVAVPLLLRLPNAFELSLAALLVAATFSTICNAAQDGYYLLTLPKADQARFAGVQTTCYKLGTLFAKGLLVYLAGHLARSMPARDAWSAVLLGGGLLYGALYLLERRSMPYPEGDVEADESGGVLWANVGRTVAVVGLGIAAYFTANALVRLSANALWATRDGSLDGPLKGWRLAPDASLLNIRVPGPGTAAELVQLFVGGALAVAFFVLSRRSIRGSTMGTAFGSFFQQSGIVGVLAFLMLYRFGEAMIMRISPLFLKDPRTAGGLGMTTENVGTIKGVVGVFGIVLGGILGGWIVSRWGLRRSIWPIAVCMHLPGLLYLWASHTLPGLGTMYGVDFVEQFGYGFGFAGYTIILQRIALRGGFRTAHYALGVGVGALFSQVSGVLGGVLQANFGYQGLFLSAVFLAIPGLATLLFLPLDDG